MGEGAGTSESRDTPSEKAKVNAVAQPPYPFCLPRTPAHGMVTSAGRLSLSQLSQSRNCLTVMSEACLLGDDILSS